MGTRKPQERRFSLEWRERTEDGCAQSKEQKAKDHKKNTKVMDSKYLVDQEIPLDKITINCDFVGGIRGTADTAGDKNKFDVERLFTAVSRGDVGELEGLEEYLRVNGKYLCNTEYQPHGKSALHKALLNLKNGRNDTIERLLNIAEGGNGREREGKLKEFVNIANKTPEYKGQTALHIAIERRSLSFVKLLVEKGADVQAKACGTCFQQHHKHSFYFGELPLSLAACTNQTEIVDFLLTNQRQKADVCDTDSQGNTVLHTLVVLADNGTENTDFVIKMYDHILTKVAQLKPELNLEKTENKQGLTPIKLAAKTGKTELLKHMLHREFDEKGWKHLSRKFTEWTYGPLCSSLYDLSSLDSYERNSVLEIVVYGHEIPTRLKMLQMEPLNQLLEDKWDRFAGIGFYLSFGMYAIYLCLISSVAFLRRDGSAQQQSYLLDYFLLLPSLMLYCVCGSFWLTGLCFLIKCQMWHAFKDRFFELLFLIQAVLLLAFVILYFSGREYIHCLVLCLSLSWVNLLFYFRGFKNMGVYCVIIQKMIYEDIFNFLLVYIIFLSGFSAAFVTLQKDPENPTSECNHVLASSLSLFFSTALELFKLTIGMGELEFTEQYRYPWVFYVLFLSYIVLTYILLFNTLIAFMNRTMEEMSTQSTDTWRLQRAITILDIERCLLCFKDRFRSGEKIELAKGNTEDCRWCFRATEVRWETNTSILEEDHDSQDSKMTASPPSTSCKLVAYQSHGQEGAQGAEAAAATPSG